ncbi:unnamed protein product [Urochloa decumbens]|uniref:Uncharacterized protein n=1 Tax=Urochloa decumbens TaxID=240449 RepID=A0ABC9FHS2_9POAL
MVEVVVGMDAPLHRGYGPLHYAALRGMVEMCKFLIKDLKFGVDTTEALGVTPLMLAIQYRRSAVGRLLLGHGADPNKTCSNGSTPLHMAASLDTCEGAELLLSKGAYVDPMWEQKTPLFLASQCGNDRMMELLLRHRADPKSAVLSAQTHTPLKAATYAHSLKGVELLIKAGADVNAGHPSTALMLAAFARYTDCIKCLLEAGADANIPDNALETDPDNSTLYAKMSLCSLHTGDKGKALDDAGTYKGMQPNLSKSCYAQGAALILMKEYDRACEALMSGLHLDFGSKPTDIAYCSHSNLAVLHRAV